MPGFTLIQAKGKSGVLRAVLLPALVTAALAIPCLILIFRTGKPETPPPTWNSKRAAAYLDGRETWWSRWPVSLRDHDTYCVSCHTALPYALARPALGNLLHEERPPKQDTELLENVRRRVRLWTQEEPYYQDSVGPHKASQSHGTEAVVNALVMVSTDAGTGRLSSDSMAALAHMWETQIRSGADRGAWEWLDFGNEPFEAASSVYYGATLAAVTVSLTPPEYLERPELQDGLRQLQEYLRRQSPTAPLVHRAILLWASKRWPALLSPSEKEALVRELCNSQNTDGGWGLSRVGWTWRNMNRHLFVTLWLRSDDSPIVRGSDAYATGLMVFVLRQAGLSEGDPHVKNGLSWLLANQNTEEGSWPGYSMQDRRPRTSETGRFMSDAATAYAVLALTAVDAR